MNSYEPSLPPNLNIGEGPRRAFQSLLQATASELPPPFLLNSLGVIFCQSTPVGGMVLFPCPLKEQEAASALKALEGCAVAAIADLRHPQRSKSSGCHGIRQARNRTIKVHLEGAAHFLMSAYLTRLDGMDKYHPKIRYRLPDTDLNQAQSVLYRRLSANLYETRNPGEYYHIHGSLEASTTLRMVGLPAFNPGLTDYRQCIDTIETAVKKYTIPELELKNSEYRQAGTPVLTTEQFQATPHYQALDTLPPFTVEAMGTTTPPVHIFEGAECYRQHPPRFPPPPPLPQALSGIRVIELCRVIAGPTIGRSLASHGASVLKITSQRLPDVPFFQLDVNAGKHTTSLHLHDPSHRAVFESLLATADVLIDGYRPGALAALGYSPAYLSELAARRGKGIVYVSEDCFGGYGGEGAGGTVLSGADWAGRPGWQQIADCVSGVAWEQGRFMGLSEPVVPPFPMSDYGTGCLGTIAALTGLYNRAVRGGSWICRTSLTQYNLFLLRLGRYDEDTLRAIRDVHGGAFWELRHSDSVDEVSRRALESMRRAFPEVFDDAKVANEAMATATRCCLPRVHSKSKGIRTHSRSSASPSLWHSRYSEAYGGVITWPREALAVDGIHIGVVRTSRPNGYDAPTWEGWEVDETLLYDSSKDDEEHNEDEAESD